MRLLKIGRWSLLPLLLSVVVVSCAPQAALFSIDERVDSGYNIDFTTQSASIFIVPDSDTIIAQEGLFSSNDSLLMFSFTDGLAKGIESRGELKEGELFIFSHSPREVEWRPELIKELSVLSNSDIVILVDSLTVERPILGSDVKVVRDRDGTTLYPYSKVRSLIHFFDGLSGENLFSLPKCDTIYWPTTALTEYRSKPFLERAESSLPLLLGKIGENLSDIMFPLWRRVERVLYTYDSGLWLEAYQNASALKFDEALDFWLQESSKRDVVKVAAAANNIAIICELRGELSLALEWLEYSIQNRELPATVEYYNFIKQKIESKKE